MSKSLAIFEKPSPGHHIVRPGRVGQLGAGDKPSTFLTAGGLVELPDHPNAPDASRSFSVRTSS
eukprot:8476295-Pyramimonas_sp.AAC.1